MAAMMDCRDFESRFDDFVEDRLDAADRAAAQAHTEACEACRTLVALEARARTRIASLGEAGADLTAGVLARTTGPACPSAQDRMVSLVDGDLARDDAALVSQHLEGCDGCAAIARTLGWLAESLPAMAEVDPGPAFTADVIARTSARRWRPRVLAARAGAVLRAWSRRPRFALEGAYAGAMILWIVFAAPISPVSGMPAKMIEMARFDTSMMSDITPVSLPRFITNPAAAGRDAWTATAGRWIASAAPGRAVLAERFSRAGHHLHEMGRLGLLLGGRILQGDFEQGGRHMRSMRQEARTILLILRGDREAPPSPPPTTSTRTTTTMKEA